MFEKGRFGVFPIQKVLNFTQKLSCIAFYSHKLLVVNWKNFQLILFPIFSLGYINARMVEVMVSLVEVLWLCMQKK
jgi:hypothetical protein